MDCMHAREALSCLVDHEPLGATDAELAAHVERCPGCAAFLRDAKALEALTRSLQTPAPDLTDVVDGVARSRRRAGGSRAPALRLGLVAVGALQLALAVPGLLFGTDDGAPIHVAHEVGAWDLALAVGFVYAAWRPLRALGLLPFAAVLSIGLVATAVIDVAHGHTTALAETTHLLDVVGTTLLYLLTSPPIRTRPQPELRAV